VAWNWNLGNGTTSSIQNPVGVFNGKGTTYFTVALTVTDTFGCKNKLTLPQYVLAIEPPSYFTATKRLICDGDSVYFSGAPQGNYTYLWDFGDGTTGSAYQLAHTYSTGSYTVSLTVTDSNGCDSTFVRTNYIRVQAYPIANFTANPLETFCYPASITFSDSSIGQNIAFWSWNFGDSPNWITSQNNTAQNLYTSPGIYDVSMALTTTYGCSDTITKFNLIDIGGPTASIVPTPTIGCINELVKFDVDNTNAYAEVFVWDFGDGTFDTSFIGNTPVFHSFSSPGNYTVTLLYSDSLGICQKTDQLVFNVHEVISSFNPNRDEGCAPLNISILNQSTGGTSYQWFLNNSLYSTTVNSSMQLTIPGWNQIMLIATDGVSSCSDTSSYPILVFPKPNIVASPDQVVCIGDSVELVASGGVDFVWNPATYLNYTSIPNPTSWPTSDISYTVEVTDTNGCKGKDTVVLTVQQVPELLLFPQDTFIFTGSYYPIETLTNIPVSYQWTPTVFLNCTDCPNPIATPTGPSWFQLVYTDANGCFVQDTAFFIDVEDDFSVYIPNAFTPNGDGRNDFFSPVTFGVKELVFMRIYNRWGQQVFESTDLSIGWDGTQNGEIAAHNSVFTYKIQLKRYNDEIMDYIGMVVLISK
jgi:gliding motility-associated-like protein